MEIVFLERDLILNYLILKIRKFYLMKKFTKIMPISANILREKINIIFMVTNRK
jgi:hypothetical protein